VTDTISAHSGIKLVHRETVIEAPYKIVNIGLSPRGAQALPALVGVNAYNTTPYHAWRCAYRQCAKLAQLSRVAPTGALQQALTIRSSGLATLAR